MTGPDNTCAPAPVGARIVKALAILTLVLLASVAVGLAVGSQRIDPASLFSDPFSHTLFFRLRLPRVLMGLVIGASLAVTAALFRRCSGILSPIPTRWASREAERWERASPSRWGGARASRASLWYSPPRSQARCWLSPW